MFPATMGQLAQPSKIAEAWAPAINAGMTYVCVGRSRHVGLDWGGWYAPAQTTERSGGLGVRTLAKRIIVGFIAGVLGTIVFFAAAYAILQSGLGWIPVSTPPPWAYAPTVPPFGVPRFANLPFWGGVWGAFLAVLLTNARGAGYWLLWTLLGAFALTLAGNFLVPLIKGQSWANIAGSINPLRLRNGLVLNGAWGLGTAVVLRAIGHGPR